MPAKLSLNVRTVGTTRSRWPESGLESLADLPRSGAPRKLTAEHVERIAGWAQAEPLTAPCLLVRHEEHGGLRVHLNTRMPRSRPRGWYRSARGTL